MPNSKQKVRDRDYFGEYQKKSCYSVQQWEKIITNEAFVSPTELAILKEIFLSANHAAPLSQLSFRHKKDISYFVDKMNQLASNIGRPNGYSVDVDLEGNEYWWYLLFWGKKNKLSGLEWKLIPELAEAIEYVYPELEDQYNSYMSEIERSEQIQYSKEDSVWIASTLLLFEKVFLEHPTDIYDLLLMQYEVSQRSQKIYGQDVDVDVITDNCNADSSKCLFPYLRDIDKYWRVCYPGEIEDAVLRPEKIDYNAYVPSKFGYVKLKELCSFLETDYCKLTDPNYIEIDESNPFYKMISFIKENGRRRYMDLTAPTEEDIERFLLQKEKSKEALKEFHSLGSILTRRYPSFVQTVQCGWLEKDNTTIKNCWIDSFELKERIGTGPAFSVLCGQNEDQKGKVVFSLLLHFPITSPGLTEQVMNKCGNLTVLTSANFKVDKSIRMDSIYSSAFDNSVVAYVSFDEQSVLEEPLQDVMIKFESAIEILASYYLDIFESLYPKEETQAPASEENKETKEEEAPASPISGSLPEQSFTASSGTYAPVAIRTSTPVAVHPDRNSTSLYHNNILIEGNSMEKAMEYAILMSVGIIENMNEEEVSKLDKETVFEKYQYYRKEGRILYTANAGLTYENFMESPYGEGIFTRFSNRAGDGRYVCIMEDMTIDMLKESMKDASYLIPTDRREGKPGHQTVSLFYSLEAFSIPSNLYFIGTKMKHRNPYSNDALLKDFQKKELPKDSCHLDTLMIDSLSVKGFVDTLNQRIRYLIGADYILPYDLFESLNETADLTHLGNLMYDSIFPHLMSDFVKSGYPNPYEGIYFVLGDYKKSNLSYQFIRKEILKSEELFGKDLNFEDKTFYSPQKDAFYQINSYVECL